MLIENTNTTTVKNAYEWLNSKSNYGSSFHGEPLGAFLQSLKGINSILDIGTGRGQFCDWAINNLCTVVYGLDFAITPDECYLNNNINFITGNCNSIPLPDNAVDITVSFDVLEHIRPEDIEQTIKEMDRVTNKFMLHKISSSPASAKCAKKNPHAQEIGNLHLIQQSRGWWSDKFKEYIPNSVIYRVDRCVFVVKDV